MELTKTNLIYPGIRRACHWFQEDRGDSIYGQRTLKRLSDRSTATYGRPVIPWYLIAGVIGLIGVVLLVVFGRRRTVEPEAVPVVAGLILR